KLFVEINQHVPIVDNFSSTLSFGKGDIFGWSSMPSKAGVAPEEITQRGLSFVRRSFDGGWNYFIANRNMTNFDGWVRLARPAKSFAMFDPLTGDSGIMSLNVN